MNKVILSFLKELEKNNNRDWFQANKSLYEEAKNEFEDFIVRQIRFAHEEMENQMKMMQEIMQTLENDNLFEILNILDKWHKNQN